MNIQKGPKSVNSLIGYSYAKLRGKRQLLASYNAITFYLNIHTYVKVCNVYGFIIKYILHYELILQYHHSQFLLSNNGKKKKRFKLYKRGHFQNNMSWKIKLDINDRLIVWFF